VSNEELLCLPALDLGAASFHGKSPFIFLIKEWKKHCVVKNRTNSKQSTQLPHGPSCSRMFKKFIPGHYVYQNGEQISTIQ
jgi:hypothetical protein